MGQLANYEKSFTVPKSPFFFMDNAFIKSPERIGALARVK
jgi:hypothetical protein